MKGGGGRGGGGLFRVVLSAYKQHASPRLVSSGNQINKSVYFACVSMLSSTSVVFILFSDPPVKQHYSVKVRMTIERGRHSSRVFLRPSIPPPEPELNTTLNTQITFNKRMLHGKQKRRFLGTFLRLSRYANCRLPFPCEAFKKDQI